MSLLADAVNDLDEAACHARRAMSADPISARIDQYDALAQLVNAAENVIACWDQE